MNCSKIGRSLSLLLILQSLSACSYVKKLFPDKERDYQFRTEIADLVIPADLKNRSFLDKNPAQNSAPAPAAQSAGVNPPVPVVKPASKPVRAESPAGQDQDSPGPVQVEVSSGAVSSLQIDQAQTQAWRMVGRALVRQNIEIVERNMEKAYYYIKYDADANKPQADGIWEKVQYIFADDVNNEQEYRISLLETAPQSTEVTIQDTQGKTLSNANATHLLKLITEGINQDAAPATDKNPAP